MPTWNAQDRVPVHVAVQSTPHAAVQPAVPVQATAQWSPQVDVQAARPVHVQAVPAQIHARPPALQREGPPGFGALGEQPASKAQAAAERRIVWSIREEYPELTTLGY